MQFQINPIESTTIDELIAKARKLAGRCDIQGLPISLEHNVGGVREGKDWRTVMRSPYGYIRGTKGVDGDALDVFLGPIAQRIRQGKPGLIEKVWIVHARDHRTGKYDEDKCMIGYRTQDEAVRDFKYHYDQPERFLGPVTEMSFDEFKEKIADTRENPRRLGQGKIVKGRRFVIEAVGSSQSGLVLIEAETGDEYLCKGKRAAIGTPSKNGKKVKVKQPDIWGPNPHYKPERKKKKKDNSEMNSTKQNKTLKDGWTQPEDRVWVKGPMKLIHTNGGKFAVYAGGSLVGFVAVESLKQAKERAEDWGGPPPRKLDAPKLKALKQEYLKSRSFDEIQLWFKDLTFRTKALAGLAGQLHTEPDKDTVRERMSELNRWNEEFNELHEAAYAYLAHDILDLRAKAEMTIAPPKGAERYSAEHRKKADSVLEGSSDNIDSSLIDGSVGYAVKLYRDLSGGEVDMEQITHVRGLLSEKPSKKAFSQLLMDVNQIENRETRELAIDYAQGHIDADWKDAATLVLDDTPDGAKLPFHTLRGIATSPASALIRRVEQSAKGKEYLFKDASKSAHMKNLEEIRFTGRAELDKEEWFEMLKSENFQKVKKLSLGDSHLVAMLLDRLATSKSFPSLKEIDISGVDPRYEAVVALYDSPHLDQPIKVIVDPKDKILTKLVKEREAKQREEKPKSKPSKEDKPKEKPKKPNNPEIAKNINAQLGRQFSAMVDAHNLIDHGDGLSFKFRGSRRSNYCKITLNENDMYDVAIGQIRKDKLHPRASGKDIHAEDLHSFFEESTGLRTSL